MLIYAGISAHFHEVILLTDKFNKTGEPPHKIVIAVDGPAASGKGTLAKKLAAELGYAYLDTGAVYRTVALLTLQGGGDVAKPEDVEKALETIRKGITPAMLADPALRTGEVAEAAAVVAQMPEVRKAVRDFQNDFAKNPPNNAPGAVLDGRDIGTVVCPDADIKFYVTAEPEERARRRFLELKDRTPGLTLEEVQKDINDRDHHDMSRTISPLKAADDAIILDNTHLNAKQALDAALEIVKNKFSGGGGPSPAGGAKGPRI